MTNFPVSSDLDLVRIAVALGADNAGGPLSDGEASLVGQVHLVHAPDERGLERVRAAIRKGLDPLGDALCAIRSPIERRRSGAFYTPRAILDPMVDWVLAQQPGRVVDPGCGSGRFALAALRRHPTLTVVAVDIDPVATLLTRAALAVLRIRRARVMHDDYLTCRLPPFEGRTAFVGNPPYVRHHALAAGVKAWAASTGRRLGYRVSKLAGLHAYFVLATALHAERGDVGSLVTSAEWLDVNYGSIIRGLLLGQLGGQAVHVIDPEVVPFDEAMTTATISCFIVGNRPKSIRFRLVKNLSDLIDLERGDPIAQDQLTNASRWTPLLRRGPSNRSHHTEVPLRSVARVHRGVATGANDFFVLTRERARALGVEQWCRPAITSAEEVQRANGVVRDGPDRRLLLCVPAEIDREAYPALDAYLRRGEEPTDDKPAISERYLPSHRRPWWYLGPCTPPAIIATYMARQAPTFALNPDGLVIVNIAHGIYPRHHRTPEQLTALVEALNHARATFRGNGRTYHGGLEKFEPREMESLLVPSELTYSHDQPALFH